MNKYHFFQNLQIARYLAKCADGVVFPQALKPEVKILPGYNKSMLAALKGRIGSTLKKKVSTVSCDDDECNEEDAMPAEDNTHPAVMFAIYHHLLEQGFQAFATDTQLTGVVAHRSEESPNLVEVCALKNCTINHAGKCAVSLLLLRISP